METNPKKGNASLIASAVGGVTLGWLLKNYVSKQQKLEEHQSVLQRIKQFEKRLYEDGQKRAYDIENIKREVKSRIEV
ncbi:hypothetical protein [Oceanobacillus damuensis]|uniref:hypothetical protein n=1 Tax=Oceanobacillus damuensis TaxID=937928 RepID=UPI000829C63B|nr:hypothetical protein [Oceanobacillus damuensis]